MKIVAGEKNKMKMKGERKTEENYIKKGKRVLKCIFLGYKHFFRREALRKLIFRGEKMISKRGGWDDRNAQTPIYLCLNFLIV